jgi:positive regulator of sigma E activity
MNQTQIGRVVALEGRYARVGITSHDTCSECGACGGERMTMLAQNEVAAVPGDQVRLDFSTKGTLAIAAVLFVLPLAATLAGVGLGNMVAGYIGVGSIPCSIIGAAVCFAISLVLAVFYDRRAKADSGSAVRIVGVLNDFTGMEE